MCWPKILPEEPEGWWGERIPISAIGTMPGIFKSRDLWISSQFRGGERIEKKRKKKVQERKMETEERKIFLHLQKGEHGKILLKKSAHSDSKTLMLQCWNSFQLPALWVIRNGRLTRHCQGQQTVSDSGWAWRRVCCVCLIHTVNIQTCIFFWNVWKWKESHSVMSDSAIPWTIQSMEFSRPETGMGSLSLLQGIFPTQGSNPGLPHCGWILYQLSHKGSPKTLEWVAYPFSSRSSWPRNQTRVSCIAGRFFTNWAIKELIFKYIYIYICFLKSSLNSISLSVMQLTPGVNSPNHDECFFSNS